jgi:hypothetical protein
MGLAQLSCASGWSSPDRIEVRGRGVHEPQASLDGGRPWSIMPVWTCHWKRRRFASLMARGWCTARRCAALRRLGRSLTSCRFSVDASMLREVFVHILGRSQRELSVFEPPNKGVLRQAESRRRCHDRIEHRSDLGGRPADDAQDRSTAGFVTLSGLAQGRWGVVRIMLPSRPANRRALRL